MRRKKATHDDMPIRAVVYARISGVDDDRTASLESQSEACRAMAERDGFLVEDEDVVHERFTGAELYDRPKLSIVRDLIKSGHYRAIYCYAIDRLSREPVHQMILAEEFARNSCDLRFVTEILDGSPESQLIQFVKGYAAKLEREKIRERTQRGKMKVVESGKLLCSGPPKYGYTYDRDTRSRSLDPGAARWVLQAYRWVSEDGYSLRMVARALNSQGVKSPFAHNGLSFKDGRESRWGKSAVKRMLTDRTYTGVTLVMRNRSAGRYKNGRQKIASVAESDWKEMGSDLTPQIVPIELFDAVQSALKKRERSADTARNEKREYLVRGMIFCGKCGKRMYADTENRKSLVYRCSSRANEQLRSVSCGGARVPAAYADKLAWEEAKSFINNKAERMAAIERERIGKTDENLQGSIDAAKAALAKEMKVERRIYELWISETDDPVFAERLQSDHAASRSRIRELKSEIETIRSRMTASDAGSIAGKLEKFCENLSTLIVDDTPFKQKRKLCEIVRMRVTGNGKDLLARVDIGVLATTS